jgi:hypothetical protein
VPGEESSAELTHQQLGDIAVFLALTFPVWVRRRNLAHAFVDDTTIRLRESVDFRFPPPEFFPEQARPKPGQRIYVPLSIGGKIALVKFSVCDESGSALVLLNAAESAGLAATGMSTIVDGLDGQVQNGEAKRGTYRETLRLIASAPVAEAEALAEKHLNGQRLGEVLHHDDMYRALIGELAKGMLMLVPMTYQPGVDRVIKKEHYEPQPWQIVSHENWLYRILIKAMPSLLLSDKLHDFSGLRTGWARSTHFSFEPPPEIQLGSARLDAHQWEPTRGLHLRVPRRREVFGRPAMDLHVKPRVDYEPDDPDEKRRKATLTALQACSQDRGSVRLRMRPSTAAVVLPAILASVASCSALWLSWARLGELDGQTSAALLLLFPATAAAFLARSGEHTFATRLLKGTRWFTALVATCALVAVGVIGGGMIRDDPPPQIAARTHCVATNTDVGKRGRPAPAIAQLDCTTPAVTSKKGPVRSDARTTVLAASVIATLLTVVLLVGLFTSYQVASARRERDDSENVHGELVADSQT